MTICNPEAYAQELRQYYSRVLNDPFFNISPFELTDSALLDRIMDYDVTKERRQLSLCTWLTIGEFVEEEMYSIEGTSRRVYLYSRGQRSMLIPMSNFRYKRTLITDNTTFPAFNSEGPNYLDLVDDHELLNPEEFFTSHKGDKILYIIGFPAVNRFLRANRQNIHYFAVESVSPENIRGHIIFAQLNYIGRFLLLPTENTPGTIVRLPDGRINQGVICKSTQDFALNLYKREFEQHFINMQNKIISSATKFRDRLGAYEDIIK